MHDNAINQTPCTTSQLQVKGLEITSKPIPTKTPSAIPCPPHDDKKLYHSKNVPKLGSKPPRDSFQEGDELKANGNHGRLLELGAMMSPPESIDGRRLHSDEVSPIFELEESLKLENQVKVGTSPTSSFVMEDQMVRGNHPESSPCYENTAFMGAEIIDSEERGDYVQIRSPFEITRDDVSVMSEGDHNRASELQGQESIQEERTRQSISKDVSLMEPHNLGETKQTQAAISNEREGTPKITDQSRHLTLHSASEVKEEIMDFEMVDPSEVTYDDTCTSQEATTSTRDEKEMTSVQMTSPISSPGDVVLRRPSRGKAGNRDEVTITTTGCSSSTPSSDGKRKGSSGQSGSGSGSDAHYHSCETSDRSPYSRPTSDELDVNVLTTSSSNRGSSIFGGSSEYETCATSQDGSTMYMSAVSSQDTSSYATARTSLSSQQSSRGSTLEPNSESSGHYAEVSSEASETLVGDLRDVATPTPADFEEEEEHDVTLCSSVAGALGSTRPSHPTDLDIPSRNDADECEAPSLSEASLTWHSSSIRTAIPKSFDLKATDLVDITGGIQQLDYDSVEYPSGRGECLSLPFSPQQPLPSPHSLTGSVASIDLVSAAGSIISQSSVSSTLSEQTRQMLSVDFSPELPGSSTTVIEGVSPGNLDRPTSPTPPVDDLPDLSHIRGNVTSLGGAITDASPCSDDADLCLIPPGDLYTHVEVDEEEENSKASNERPESVDGAKGIKIVNKNRYSGSFADSASTSSSLQEFERLESEMLKSSSLHGTPKKVTRLGSEKDDGSVSSLTEFEKLESECQASSACLTGAERPVPVMEQSLLSEIDEGHESQASDSGETVTGPVEDSDDTDELKTESQIDNLIRASQPEGEERRKMKVMSSMSLDAGDGTSETSTQRKLSSRRTLSTDSNDSHARSSISTTNTDSLLARINDLDRDLVDDGPNIVDSVHQEDERDVEANQSLVDDQVTPVAGVDEKPFPGSDLPQETSSSLLDSFQPQVTSACMLASTDSMDMDLMTASFLSTATMISSSETIELAPPTQPKLLSEMTSSTLPGADERSKRRKGQPLQDVSDSSSSSSPGRTASPETKSESKKLKK